MQEHEAVSSLGAHGGACSVGTTSRLWHWAHVVCGSTGNDTRSLAPVVLGKSRGRDSTSPTNVSNANEYTLASEQEPVLARAQEFGVCVFWSCSGRVVSRFVFFCVRHFDDISSECDGNTRGSKSLLSKTLPGNMCAQTTYQTSPLGQSEV